MSLFPLDLNVPLGFAIDGLGETKLVVCLVAIHEVFPVLFAAIVALWTLASFLSFSHTSKAQTHARRKLYHFNSYVAKPKLAILSKKFGLGHLELSVAKIFTLTTEISALASSQYMNTEIWPRHSLISL